MQKEKNFNTAAENLETAFPNLDTVLIARLMNDRKDEGPSINGMTKGGKETSQKEKGWGFTGGNGASL